ncbi:hypothetical protein JI76_38035 (plasmid) [Streptomyces anulatus]|uniref:DUF6197 family protein n=1 Tax=Streptomyces anulatus TaxID=1892 RepID=UPI0006DB1B19|nr:hypothetical protein [Streptomyces anulatus]KPL26286.1 hypothetical protein JI76_38035 [Streptomyces anulatus]
MPKTTNTPAAAVFPQAALQKAQELVVESYLSVWTGPSGEESSGEAVARHLEATVALLDTDGWIRVHTYNRERSSGGAGVDLADDESMTVKQMLRALLRVVRNEIESDVDIDPRRTLSTALRHVGEGGLHGDTDTAVVAGYVLDRLIQAHTGSASARATAWAERQHRTHADITALLCAGARFARTYGPGQESAAA